MRSNGAISVDQITRKWYKIDLRLKRHNVHHRDSVAGERRCVTPCSPMTALRHHTSTYQCQLGLGLAICYEVDRLAVSSRDCTAARIQ